MQRVPFIFFPSLVIPIAFFIVIPTQSKSINCFSCMLLLVCYMVFISITLLSNSYEQFLLHPKRIARLLLQLTSLICSAALMTPYRTKRVYYCPKMVHQCILVFVLQYIVSLQWSPNAQIKAMNKAQSLFIILTLFSSR